MGAQVVLVGSDVPSLLVERLLFAMGAAISLRLRPLAATVGSLAVACTVTLILLSRRKSKLPGGGDDSQTRAAARPVAEVSNEEVSRLDSAVETLAAPRISHSPEQYAWACRLAHAAALGDANEVSRMLSAPWPQGDARSPLDVPAELETIWPNITAVGAASFKGHAAVLNQLLDTRADPNCLCQKVTQWDGAFTLTENDSAMCLAARAGHRSCVEVLLAAGADPNVECSSDYFEGAVEWSDEGDGSEHMVYSAMDAASMARRPDMAELIKQNGGKTGVKTTSQRRNMITSGSRMGA